MAYRTINLPFLVKIDIASKIIFTARMYRSAVICGFERIRYLNYYPSRREIEARCYGLAKLFTGYSYYANAVCRDIYEIVQSCKELNVKLTDVKLKNWLYFESKGDNRHGNTGIKLVSLDKVKVKLLVRYSEVKELLGLANRGQISYNARVYINDHAPNVVKGVIQVSVPEEL